MAAGGLAPAELSPQEQSVSAPPSADFLYLSGRTKQLVPSEADRYFEPGESITPTNEYEIALPVFALDCVCGQCSSYTRHHLHSTDNLFRAAGPISTEFRELLTLSVWTPRCRHAEHHVEYSVNTFLPAVDVMEQCIYEEKIIRDIVMNGHTVIAMENRIDNDNVHPREKAGLKRRREELLAERPETIRKLEEVIVTPEELVTGALLLAAPNHARSRLIEGTGYALTGILPRDKVQKANEFAQDVMLELEPTLQTGVDEVELAA